MEYKLSSPTIPSPASLMHWNVLFAIEHMSHDGNCTSVCFNALLILSCSANIIASVFMPAIYWIILLKWASCPARERTIGYHEMALISWVSSLSRLISERLYTTDSRDIGIHVPPLGCQHKD